MSACDPVKRERALTQVAEIFFETSQTRAFASEAEIQRFFMRWCGRYAEVQPGAFLVAFDHEKRVLGYLAGCIDSFGESARAIASEIDYFTADFCAGMQAYPSHFHINVSPVHQGRGVGHSLTMHFIDLCRRSGSPGIHIVTGAASRAVRFYEACNFRCLAPGVAASAAHAVMVYPLT